MGLADQFKDKAQELADQAKSALGNQGDKTQEAEEKARQEADEAARQGQETVDDQRDDWS